jgi:hypothetical protein
MKDEGRQVLTEEDVAQHIHAKVHRRQYPQALLQS